MLRYAYSTNAYTRFALLPALKDIAAAGFDGVEILADVPHAFPPLLRSSSIEAIRRSLRRHRLRPANLNANTSVGLDSDRRDPDGFWPSLCDPSLPYRELRIDLLRRTLDLARELGAPAIGTASGRLPRGMRKPRAWKHLCSSMEQVLRYAEEKPAVRIGIEYEPGFIIGNGTTLQRLFRSVDHPLLGANLDLGHAVCVGEDPGEVIERLAGRIWNIHVEDIRGRVHRHLIPGEGTIDFVPILRALKWIRYSGFLTLELYPYKRNPGAAGRKGLEYLKGQAEATVSTSKPSAGAGRSRA